MRNNMKIIFVIIATLVGAGFASGKEIYSFFFCYGIYGIIGIVISSFIISFIVYKVLKICIKNNIFNYSDFCEFIGNKKNINKNSLKSKNVTLSSFLNNIVNIFLIITFFIMISGFTTFLQQEFSVNKIIGSIIIIVLCYFTFLKNIEGLIKISNYLIPFLIVFLLYISTKNVKFVDNYNQLFSEIQFKYSYINAFFKSILYGCYNCIILIPVLVNITKIIEKEKNVKTISVLTFLVIFILSSSIYNLLLQGNNYYFNLEMPLIQIVKKYGIYYEIMYQIMIGIAIFTTAISSGYTFLINCSKSNQKYKKNLLLISICSIFFCQLSFSTLVNLMYPVLGAVGVFEILLICLKD